MDIKMSTIILIVIIPGLLVAYFAFSLNFYPHLYLSTRQVSQALPKIISVDLNASSSSDGGNLRLGESFIMTIASANLGDTADLQITSVSFPNITTVISDDDVNKIVSILYHNFTQSPIFISAGDEIGSQYAGLSKTTIAKYPFIQFYNNPWTRNTSYEAQLRIRPVSEGDFVIFVKTVALPYTTNLSHYPTEGIQDHQQEFVNAYRVTVTQ